MEYVKQIHVKLGMSIGQLVTEMRNCGVLGAGRLAKAVDLVTEMFGDPDYTVFLTLAGPMVPGGLRRIIKDLIDEEYVDVIMASGANIVHDMMEALGYSHIKGTLWADDVKLRRRKLGRIGDIYVRQEAFHKLEREIHKFLEDISKKEIEGPSIRRLLYDFGTKLNDPSSILTSATKRNAPIFCPGLIDSMIGFHIWTFSQLKKFSINPVADLHELSEIVFKAKKVGAIILGGGLPKHHVLSACMLREGIDVAVQITLDRPEGGSLSGAPLEEAVSWGKVKASGKHVTVIGDATMIFPVIIAAALEKLHRKERLHNRKSRFTSI